MKLGTNIQSLMAQRQLGNADSALSTVFERLSSGLRINKASDDPAGLQIADTLSADAKVYQQAVRNLNDGMSVLNIAAAALDELTHITTRIQELAAQAMPSGTAVVVLVRPKSFPFFPFFRGNFQPPQAILPISWEDHANGSILAVPTKSACAPVRGCPSSALPT